VPAAAADRGGKAQGRDEQDGPDQQHAEIAAESLGEWTAHVGVPGVIEHLLDLLDQGEHGVEQHREADCAQHLHLGVVHELDDPLGDLDGLLAQRLQCLQQHGLELVVHPEPLEHREAHRQQRHQ